MVIIAYNTVFCTGNLLRKHILKVLSTKQKKKWQLWDRIEEVMNCSQSGSSVHGVFQARILEWVAISSSRGSSPPRDLTHVSDMAGRFFTF